MSSNTSEQSYDITRQIEDLAKDIEKMGENIDPLIDDILTDGAGIIEKAQRQMISSKSSKLSSLIKKGSIFISSKGNKNILIGYDSDAIKEAPEGVVLEFGRPGKRSKGVVQKGKYAGRKIGYMKSVPHIRPAFDATQSQTQDITIKKFDEFLKEQLK